MAFLREVARANLGDFMFLEDMSLLSLSLQEYKYKSAVM